MSEDNMIQCPYNPTHMVVKRRMAIHLIKCRRQHLMEKFETCPFNTTHDVPVPELQHHVEVCCDRKKLEKVMYVMDEPEQEDENLINVELPPAPENWDEESGASYLNIKEEKLEKKLVFRQPVGLARSERKAFVRNEVLKFGRGSPPS